MTELLLPLLRNTGMLAVIAVIYGFGLQWRAVPHAWMLGILGGCGAVLSMLDPMELRPGILIDSRTTMIMLSGFFGGPVSAFLSALIGGSYRAFLGGTGVQAGLLSMAISAVVGVAGNWLFVREGTRVERRDIALFSLMVPLTSLGVLVLPHAAAVQILRETLLPLNIVRMFGVVFLGLLILHERRRIDAEAEVRRLAYVDELSGLSNRRAFYQQLQQAWARWDRYKHPFSLVLIDIDRFKAINDRFGHPVGDEVIRRLAALTLEECRASDVPARIGGEEFVLLLPNTESAGATTLAERLRVKIENEVVRVDGAEVRFTVSLGVSSDLGPGSAQRDALASADQALYAAKHRGRNQVIASKATDRSTAIPSFADY